jgi:hypothetical protein
MRESNSVRMSGSELFGWVELAVIFADHPTAPYQNTPALVHSFLF